MKILHMVAFILLIVGGLNWLLFGVFDWEIGSLVGGMDSVIARALYVLIGLAAVYELVTHKNTCRTCGKAGDSEVAGV